MWQQIVILSFINVCAFSTVSSKVPVQLLGLNDRAVYMKKPSLRNSASKFLLNVYNKIHQDEEETMEYGRRYRRTLSYDTNFITEIDRLEIDKCNNIITFSSKIPKLTTNETNTMDADIHIAFNTNDVPSDLKLVHSTLRIYQDPSLGRYKDSKLSNTSISIYQRIYSRKQEKNEFKIFSTINATTTYKGWMEFNVTKLISKWLQYRSLQQVIYGNEILVRASLYTSSGLGEVRHSEVAPSDLGVVSACAQFEDLQPFIIAYFNGPELMAKLQKLRFKREVVKSKRNANIYMQKPLLAEEYKHPEICQRINFTLDFKDLHMHNWVIAPKQFEAYFCGGGCNFPLGSKMNATNHAIVQTLMHLRQPNLPKACCVPTKLGSISILHYLNEDSVNLSKYPQSVAKECGCH